MNISQLLYAPDCILAIKNPSEKTQQKINKPTPNYNKIKPNP